MSAFTSSSDSSEEITLSRMNLTHRPNAFSPESDASWMDPAEWCYGETDTGRAREANEDNFLCDSHRKLFIVADGMGGHAAGEEASRIAIEQLSDALTLGVLLHSTDEKAFTAELVAALNAANAEVIRQGESNMAWRDMGTTAVVAVLRHRSLHIASIGDSRAYLLRGETLWQLSRDHSVAATLAEQGHITPDQIRTHPMRNRLTACLGIDAYIRPASNCVALEPEDRILLCSDGLWDMIDDQEIAGHLYSNSTPKAVANALIVAANEAGGKDNITAVVLRIPQELLVDQSELLHNNLSAEIEPNSDNVSPSADDTVVDLSQERNTYKVTPLTMSE